MKKVATLWTFALTILSGFAPAQNFTGQWQGTLHSRDLRYFLKISVLTLAVGLSIYHRQNGLADRHIPAQSAVRSCGEEHNPGGFGLGR